MALQDVFASAPFLDQVYLGNTGLEWLAAGGTALACFLILVACRMVANRLLLRVAARTSTGIDDILAPAASRVTLVFIAAISAWAGSLALELPAEARAVASGAAATLVLVQLALSGSVGIAAWAAHARDARKDRDPGGATTIGTIGFLMRAFLWCAAVLLILQNLGVNVSALMAGLGIGGVAVALAIQNILGDLFASFSILLDRPFIVGDFIVVGEESGTVEKIGIKTTRLRSLEGEEIVFSNADLLRSRVHNYRRMTERQVVMKFGVVYRTSLDALKAVPAIVREVIASRAEARFGRAHLKELGDSALVFEVAYSIGKPDYDLFMETQQAVNLALLERFEKEGIRFAHPTTTVHVEPEASKT